MRAGILEPMLQSTEQPISGMPQQRSVPLTRPGREAGGQVQQLRYGGPFFYSPVTCTIWIP